MAGISNVNETDFMEKSKAAHRIFLPDGTFHDIRERNGDDEDTVSRVGDFKSGIGIPKFLAALIVSTPHTYETINTWKIRNKWYMLFKERLLTFGTHLEFVFEFRDGKKQEWFEDLSKFDWDFSKPFPVEGEEGYEDYQKRKDFICLRYPEGEEKIKGTTSSNKNYRMDYLVGSKEISMIDVNPDQLTNSDRFRLRNFELQMKSGVWSPIQKFNMLTAMDMAEIREHLDEVDQNFDPVIRVEHPNGRESEEVSIFQLNDFFFPKAKKRKR